MYYTSLNLTQSKEGFTYTYFPIKGNRVRRKTVILGYPGQACVNCPRGTERKWKPRLFDYVEKNLINKRKRLDKTIKQLEKAKNEYT